MGLKRGEFLFDLIDYEGPKDSNRSCLITPEKLVGFDSECDVQGRTLVFCLSDGTAIEPDDFPRKILTKEYRGKHFVCWNLNFEQGAIFQKLPRNKRLQLSYDGKCTHEGVDYYVVANKHLRISKRRNQGQLAVNRRKRQVSCCIHFWDLFPFYGTSLEKAAETYLSLKKSPIDYQNLTKEYYDENWRAVDLACVNHAELTRQLGVYLLKTLTEMGIQVTNLYSQASVAAEWFAKTCGVEDVKCLWEDPEKKELLRFACEAYRGGKFEIAERGYFPYLYDYDITSAYPDKIAGLVSLKGCRVVRQVEVPQGQQVRYGFLRCRLKMKHQVPHTVGILKAGVTFQSPCRRGNRCNC